MANLIITIIGIALIAVAAIMGAYYGGVAFENARMDVIANTMINESQQVLLAMRVWAVDNNQPDVCQTCATGLPNFDTFINAGLLTGYPTAVVDAINASDPDGFKKFPLEEAFYNCFDLNNSGGWFQVDFFSYKNGNYFSYIFDPIDGATCGNGGGLTKTANSPITKLALSVNQKMGIIANSNLTMSALGVPYATAFVPINQTNSLYNWAWDIDNIGADSNGNILTNMCYFDNAGLGEIVCVFGPS